MVADGITVEKSTPFATAPKSDRNGDLDPSEPKPAGVEIVVFVVWTIESDVYTAYMFLESYLQ